MSPLLLRALCWVMLVPFLSGASTSWGETVDELTEWAEGPVQWLLLSEERKQIRRVSTSREATTFVEEFWTLRDPQPDEPGNPYREAFAQRVEAADVLYGEGRTRGSLTDRGRALILLGPPTHVTISTEPALAWDPVESSDSRVTMRRVDVEIWGYRFEDLPPGLVELWLEKKKKAAENTLTLTVMFRTVAHRTALVEGEALLETASRAAVTSSD